MDIRGWWWPETEIRSFSYGYGPSTHRRLNSSPSTFAWYQCQIRARRSRWPLFSMNTRPPCSTALRRTPDLKALSNDLASCQSETVGKL